MNLEGGAVVSDLVKPLRLKVLSFTLLARSCRVQSYALGFFVVKSSLFSLPARISNVSEGIIIGNSAYDR